VQLRYISIPRLIAEAGGNPWAINESLQSGRPAQISDLAQAFHAAARCTTESSTAFDDARRRFEASRNRENGDHPINDSAEVQRTTQSLGAQSLVDDSFLHSDPYPNTSAPGQPNQCEAGNERYLSGRQVIGTAPVSQSVTEQTRRAKDVLP